MRQISCQKRAWVFAARRRTAGKQVEQDESEMNRNLQNTFWENAMKKFHLALIVVLIFLGMVYVFASFLMNNQNNKRPVATETQTHNSEDSGNSDVDTDDQLSATSPARDREKKSQHVSPALAHGETWRSDVVNENHVQSRAVAELEKEIAQLSTERIHEEIKNLETWIFEHNLIEDLNSGNLDNQKREQGFEKLLRVSLLKAEQSRRSLEQFVPEMEALLAQHQQLLSAFYQSENE